MSLVIIAHQIQQRIWQQTGLTASAGVSVNKFLAKIASGINKPKGLCLIAPQDVAQFVDTLARAISRDWQGNSSQNA
ncbi:MAG: hypothetical protein HC851_01405 [Acaryochloris sp. RU_4_1]|nr:hypothetical protein [Acaryochloris sp. RU_4_1]NJR53492.1 hypothetical protein [Acaryochloris sp. CRU_2_0]